MLRVAWIDIWKDPPFGAFMVPVESLGFRFICIYPGLVGSFPKPLFFIGMELYP